MKRLNLSASLGVAVREFPTSTGEVDYQEILESLSLVRGPLACATYTQMLKLACDAFSKDYFSEHYQALEEADYAAISREDYLKELERLDIEVGKKNNLGEIKSFVLLQVLSVMLGEQIYVFCSDDKNARNGATNFEDNVVVAFDFIVSAVLVILMIQQFAFKVKCFRITVQSLKVKFIPEHHIPVFIKDGNQMKFIIRKREKNYSIAATAVLTRRMERN